MFSVNSCHYKTDRYSRWKTRNINWLHEFDASRQTFCHDMMFSNEHNIIPHLQNSFHISKTEHHSYNFKRNAITLNKSVFLEHFTNQKIIELIHRALRQFLQTTSNPREGKYQFNYTVTEQNLGFKYSLVNNIITRIAMTKILTIVLIISGEQRIFVTAFPKCK